MRRVVYAVLIAAVVICSSALGTAESDRLRARGIELGAEGDFAGAKRELQQSLDIDPYQFHARRLIELADEVLQNKFDEGAAALYFQAVALYDSAQTDEALSRLASVLAIESDYYFTYLFRGTIYADTGDTTSAMADFDRTIELNPEAFEAYFMRGTLNYFSGRTDDALPDLERSIALNPDFAPGHTNVGNVYAEAGNHDDAIAEFSAAIHIDPVWAVPYFNRGNSYAELGDYRRALNDYDKAIELDPWYYHAYIGRGVAYTERGNFDQAVADFDSALAINPDDPISIYNKAIAYEQAQKSTEAVDAYRQFVAAAPPLYPDEVAIAKEAIDELNKAASTLMYFMFYMGIGFHTGNVEEIGDAYQFPSTQASDIYKNSPQFGIVLGERSGHLMMELSVEGGLLWLTDDAQAEIDSVYGDEYKVSSEFFSLEFTIGPTYRARLYPFRQYLQLYGAASAGLLIQTLFFEGEKDPVGDFGFGVALKAGLDYTPVKSRPVFVRLGTRYQLLAEGVGVPRTFTVLLGLGIPW